MADDLDAGEVAAELQVGIAVFVRWLRQAPAGGELTLPEVAVLSRLERTGPSSTSDLARSEQITPQAMGETLAALEARGLVERRPDPGDGRRVAVSVTGSGRAALRDRRGARTEQVARALAGRFTRAELEALAAAAPLIRRLGEGL
jgi:DNA-binding MarR family transcriptional regulator